MSSKLVVFIAWLVVVLVVFLVCMDVCSSIENTLRVLNGGIKISKIGTYYPCILT